MHGHLEPRRPVARRTDGGGRSAVSVTYRRAVTWSRRVARDALLVATRNTLGSTLTLFRPNLGHAKPAAADIRAHAVPIDDVEVVLHPRVEHSEVDHRVKPAEALRRARELTGPVRLRRCIARIHPTDEKAPQCGAFLAGLDWCRSEAPFLQAIRPLFELVAPRVVAASFEPLKKRLRPRPRQQLAAVRAGDRIADAVLIAFTMRSTSLTTTSRDHRTYHDPIVAALRRQLLAATARSSARSTSRAQLTASPARTQRPLPGSAGSRPTRMRS